MSQALRQAWNARPFLPLQALEALPSLLPAATLDLFRAIWVYLLARFRHLVRPLLHFKQRVLRFLLFFFLAMSSTLLAADPVPRYTNALSLNLSVVRLHPDAFLTCHIATEIR